MDFYRNGQLTSTIKGLSDVPLIRGLCQVRRTLTTKGLNDPPLVGGLCLVQRTLTRKSLNDLPLIGGLCLVPMTDFNHDRPQGYKQEQAKEHSGADEASKEHTTLMQVGEFALDAWLMLG